MCQEKALRNISTSMLKATSAGLVSNSVAAMSSREIMLLMGATTSAGVGRSRALQV